MQKTDEQAMSFWDHLDVLRAVLMRICLAIVAASAVCFCFKDTLFSVVLAPASDNFFLYRWMDTEPFHLHLINTELTEQFMTHMKVAFMAGLLLASPYVIYALFQFISPALYQHERKSTTRLLIPAYLMFLLGVSINYCTIFPMTVNFLSTYQISERVESMLSISSYIDTLLAMSLLFGLVFEIPILAWLMGKIGLLKSQWMTNYRRHAIVIILIIAAIITPTGDAFTLTIVSLPIWILYESSIYIVKRIEKSKAKQRE